MSDLDVYAAAPFVLQDGTLSIGRELECIDGDSAITVAERLSKQPGHVGRGRIT
jgi:hypothetical protein